MLQLGHTLIYKTMDQASVFQQKFPLSPKKFWKKIWSDIIGYAFLSLIGGIILGFVIAVIIAVIAGPNETWSTSASFVIGIVVLTAIVLYVVLMAIRVWYWKKYIATYYYNGEDFFITIKKGVFAPREIHVQYQKIQDVYVDQDIIDRILGIYDVHIASATSTSGIEAHIDGVEKDVAEGLKQFLLNAVRSGSQNQNQNIAQPQTPAAANQPSSGGMKFTEDVSSEKYPLTNKWLISAILGRIISSTIITIFISVIIFMPEKKSFGLIDVIGWSWTIVAFIGLLLLGYVWNMISLFLWKKNYSFRFDPDTIYYRTGVISIAEKHMPYASIQNVNMNQSVFDRLLGIADVVIENAASHQVVVNKRVQSVADSIIIEGLSKEDASHLTESLKAVTLSRDSRAMGL